MAQQEAGTGSGEDAATDEMVREAIDELYALEPESFMARRGELVAAAKAAKDQDAAKRITALRKPTRSAFAINRMVRREPDALESLLDLGDDLRRAERSVDAAQVRELSKQRRRLIDDVTRRALEEDDPTAVRDEVASTLQAALADEDVAEQVRSGSLVRAATFEGFGFPGAPDLSVVRTARPAGRTTRSAGPTGGAGPGSGRSAPARGGRAAETETAGAEAPEADTPGDAAEDVVVPESATDRRRREKQEKEEREQERVRRKVQAEAEDVLERAEDAAAEATKTERDLRKKIRALEDEIYEARRALDEARAAVKRTAAEQREARLALDRLD